MPRQKDGFLWKRWCCITKPFGNTVTETFWDAFTFNQTVSEVLTSTDEPGISVVVCERLHVTAVSNGTTFSPVRIVSEASTSSSDRQSGGECLHLDSVLQTLSDGDNPRARQHFRRRAICPNAKPMTPMMTRSPRRRHLLTSQTCCRLLTCSLFCGG